MPTAAERLRENLQDRGQPLRLYGSTPPRAGASAEAVHEAADKLVARLHGLPVDGLVVYDIQDESGRTSVPRPFPFTGTVEPRAYSRLLMERSGLPAINYKSLGNFDEAQWAAWLDETARDYGLCFLSVVGRPTSGVHYSLSLPQAFAQAKRHPANFSLGGVLIAERDSPTHSEAERLLTKSAEGCSYFISQTVYHAEPTIRVLGNYVRDCELSGATPRRIVFTFAPCGREKTMAFIKWLGVNVPPECERSIFAAADPLKRSIEICRDNLRAILDRGYALPLGINVESVSIIRDEIDATVELFGVLSEVLQGR